MPVLECWPAIEKIDSIALKNNIMEKYALAKRCQFVQKVKFFLSKKKTMLKLAI